MMFLLCFFLIILLSNIIQGITGFAGTLLAMPFLLYLIDLSVAKEVLNFAGLVGSIYIVIKNWKHINIFHCIRMIAFMMVGMIIGIALYDYLPIQILMIIFPIFIIAVAINGLWKFIDNKKDFNEWKNNHGFINKITLLFGGIFHGLFISGGPLLVMYATKTIHEKNEFRATLSAVWVVLNGYFLVQSIIVGNINEDVSVKMMLTLVPLFLGVIVGGKLLAIMNKRTFMIISYILLLISGIMLLI